MHILLSNDDGLASPLLRPFAEALAALPGTRVSVVVPARERSWIGRAVSRHGEVRVERVTGFPGQAWAVHGTPTDCVNLALGYLLKDDRPDVVASGINLGLNATVSLILCSGTVAAAIEGAAWGLPAAAFSLHLSMADFTALADRPDPYAPPPLPSALAPTVTAAAAHAAAFTTGLAGNPQPGLRVHNINYPFSVTADTPVRATAPEGLAAGPLFVPTDTPDTYTFRYREAPASLPPGLLGDRTCLAQGAISHSILDFHLLGRTPAPTSDPTPDLPAQ